MELRMAWGTVNNIVNELMMNYKYTSQVCNFQSNLRRTNLGNYDRNRKELPF